MERRRGRPPKVGEAKRVSFHGRLRLGLHEQLQAAAERANRSLNEEVEHRLERTLALEAPRDPSALLAEDSGKSELEARVDKVMAELKEKLLLLVGYHGAVETKQVSDSEAKPEPKRKPRRPQQREPGQSLEQAYETVTRDNAIWQRAAAIYERIDHDYPLAPGVDPVQHREQLTDAIYRAIAERVANGTDNPAQDETFLGDLIGKMLRWHFTENGWTPERFFIDETKVAVNERRPRRPRRA